VDGYDLVALIFAREISDSLTGLVKTIDRQLEEANTRRRSKDKLGIFVVFCSDDPSLEAQLQKLIAREGVKHVVITLSRNKAQGPPRYRIAREAELTVAVYNRDERVVANFVLDSEDLTPERAGAILTSLKKVLP
jgi:hypothetical protein